jgi:hypothetical protein
MTHNAQETETVEISPSLTLRGPHRTTKVLIHALRGDAEVGDRTLCGWLPDNGLTWCWCRWLWEVETCQDRPLRDCGNCIAILEYRELQRNLTGVSA